MSVDLSGLRQCKSPAVIQIGGFVQSNQLNDARPQPRRGIEGGLMVFRQIGSAMPGAGPVPFGDHGRARRRLQDSVLRS